MASRVGSTHRNDGVGRPLGEALAATLATSAAKALALATG
jgi:hypothetical protein